MVDREVREGEDGGEAPVLFLCVVNPVEETVSYERWKLSCDDIPASSAATAADALYVALAELGWRRWWVAHDPFVHQLRLFSSHMTRQNVGIGDDHEV